MQINEGPRALRRPSEKKITQEVSEEPRKEWARLYVDDGEESVEAVDLLRAHGYSVEPLPVRGIFGPKLLLGRRTYEGLSQIKAFIEKER